MKAVRFFIPLITYANEDALSQIATLPFSSLINSLQFLQIGQLKYLGILALGGNRLTSLPEEIGCLTSLQSLSVPGNRLATLDALACGRPLPELKALGLFGNCLREVPEGVLGRFPGLTEVWLQVRLNLDSRHCVIDVWAGSPRKAFLRSRQCEFAAAGGLAVAVWDAFEEAGCKVDFF